MRISVRAVVKAIVILILVTLLPLEGQRYIPPEALRFLSTQSGFGLIDVLNRIAIIGVAFFLLTLMMGHTGKTSTAYLALSTVNKLLWLIVVLFMLGLGYPETGGLAVLGGSGGSASNIVVIDLRLFAGLAALVVVLMIFRSVLKFQEERNTTSMGQEPSSSVNAS